MTYGFLVEQRYRNGDQVVAADDALIGKALGGPSSTSERISRIVRVIGAQVMAVRTAIAASRVRTHTGRRPAGGPSRPDDVAALYHSGAVSDGAA